MRWSRKLKEQSEFKSGDNRKSKIMFCQKMVKCICLITHIVQNVKYDLISHIPLIY